MVITEKLVGLPTPTAEDAQKKVILQTNVHLWSKNPVTVRVPIPLSRAIAPRGNWKKKICTVKATEGISYYEARMRVKQTQSAPASNASYPSAVRAPPKMCTIGIQTDPLPASSTYTVSPSTSASSPDKITPTSTKTSTAIT